MHEETMNAAAVSVLLHLLLLTGRGDVVTACPGHDHHHDGNDAAVGRRGRRHLRRHGSPRAPSRRASYEGDDGAGGSHGHLRRDQYVVNDGIIAHDAVDEPTEGHHEQHRLDYRHHHHHDDGNEPQQTTDEALLASDYTENLPDVFESCLVICYNDLVIKYGSELADSMVEQGFVFDKSCPPPGTGDSIEAELGNTTSTSRRRLGASAWHWNMPSMRNDVTGKIEIPFAIQSTTYFTQETLDVIALAMSIIESETGVIQFVPRSNEVSHVYFQYLSGYCAANVGIFSNQATNVYLGWCRTQAELGSIIHEILHALGFWHEQSRPDRDDHVTIVWENMVSGKENNFAKMTDVDSLGSPYDYGSIMHYPPWAFSKSGSGNTIVPTRTLEPHEVMGQRVRMSDSDIAQLRLLYQCSTGTRNANSLTSDNLCSAECKCWENAPGSCHGSDDECMGDLVCAPAPQSDLPVSDARNRDMLPPWDGSTRFPDCSTQCDASCCGFSDSVLLCPETCGTTAPAYFEPSDAPDTVCQIAPTETGSPTTSGPTRSPSGSPSLRPSESRGPSMIPSRRPSLSPTTASPTSSPTSKPTANVRSHSLLL